MLNEASQAPTPTTSNYDQSPRAEALPTFLDHVHELRRRLFWVVAVVLVVSAVAYSFLNDVINVLTAPLGDKQLYYLTPAGGLTFTFKLVSFVGFVAGVPVLMYHIYRFLEPLMGTKRRSALFYVGLSTLFAAGGVAFAYFISLPAALHFLTNFNIGNIQSMLTVDSYLSFVVTYLLGAALLFQIPLLLLIINNMTPLQPKKLMKLQKFVVVGAFILAAVISPTPDIMNQTFLAIPIVAMYQLGVMLVWLQRRSAARQAKRPEGRQQLAAEVPEPQEESKGSVIPGDILADLMAEPAPIARPAVRPAPVRLQPKPAKAAPVAAVARPAPITSFKGRPIQRRGQQIKRQVHLQPQHPRPQPVQSISGAVRSFSDIRPVAARPAAVSSRPALQARPAPRLTVPARSIDGFMRPSPATSS